MRRVLLGVAAMALMMGVVMLIPVGSPIGGEASASNAASHVDGGTCYLLDSNGPPVLALTAHRLTTSNGRTTLKCYGDVGPTGTGNITLSGFNCYLATGADPSGTGLVTTDSREVIGGEGGATMICNF